MLGKDLIMNTVPVNVKVDSEVKMNASKILASIGLSTSAAINVFLRQIIFHKGLPFDLKVPDRLTVEAIQELESGKGISSDNVDDFLKETGICE